VSSLIEPCCCLNLSSCVEGSWLGATAGSTFSGGCSVLVLVLASWIPSCQGKPSDQGAALLASARVVLASRLVANHLFFCIWLSWLWRRCPVSDIFHVSLQTGTDLGVCSVNTRRNTDYKVLNLNGSAETNFDI